MGEYAWYKSNSEELKTLLEIVFTGYPNNSPIKTDTELNYLSHESLQHLTVSVLGEIYCPRRINSGLNWATKKCL